MRRLMMKQCLCRTLLVHLVLPHQFHHGLERREEVPETELEAPVTVAEFLFRCDAPAWLDVKRAAVLEEVIGLNRLAEPGSNPKREVVPLEVVDGLHLYHDVQHLRLLDRQLEEPPTYVPIHVAPNGISPDIYLEDVHHGEEGAGRRPPIHIPHECEDGTDGEGFRAQNVF